jgi:tRNA-splicing endonuclease subunit Sen2
MAPRWKGKDAKSKKEAEAEALKEPMSKIISQLQSSLVQSDTCGFLSDNCVHLALQTEQLDLLDKACFGRPVRIVDKDMYWFQLTVEEAFYLCYSLKCLKIKGVADTCPLNDEELWRHFKSKKEAFPYFYKAYSHLRMKNWVVRSGAQYGVDFIVYRHHPARVHSEYGVLVLSHDNDGDLNGRLREWSDVQCTIRLLGSVAKTLLVLYVNKNGHSDESPLCLTNYTIEERTISRRSPEQCRERSI